MNKRKDEKIQLYRKKTVELSGSTRTAMYREFIYSENTYLSGGLWANAREMQSSELINNGMQQGVKTIKFTVNRNSKITEDLKVIYRNEIYDIRPPIDELDGRTIDITFMAVKTVDTATYLGDLYEQV